MSYKMMRNINFVAGVAIKKLRFRMKSFNDKLVAMLHIGKLLLGKCKRA